MCCTTPSSCQSWQATPHTAAVLLVNHAPGSDGDDDDDDATVVIMVLCKDDNY
jgi:hypothetical protein